MELKWTGQLEWEIYHEIVALLYSHYSRQILLDDDDQERYFPNTNQAVLDWPRWSYGKNYFFTYNDRVKKDCNKIVRSWYRRQYADFHDYIRSPVDFSDRLIWRHATHIGCARLKHKGIGQLIACKYE